MTTPSDPPRLRPPFFWISIVAAGIGVTIFGVRLVTLPESRLGTAGLGILIAVAVTAAIVIGMRVALAARVRDAERDVPRGLVLPVAVGSETGAALRWAAGRLGDERLRTGGSGSAVIAVDAAGLHLVRGPGSHGVIPATALSVAEPGRTMVGARVMDSIVLTMTFGDVSGPLHLVPMRLRGNPFRGLAGAERREVARTLEAALRGAPVEPGWRY